jgi:aconitase A
MPQEERRAQFDDAAKNGKNQEKENVEQAAFEYGQGSARKPVHARHPF